jgi:alpha-L-fucosidase
MLVDIVSKNGNLLLSVPVRGNGTIDEKEIAILEEIKEWMDVNGQSIYGTRIWKTFGEGPMAEASNPINAQGFNENNNYSAADIRFVQRNDTVFATTLRYPEGESCTIKALGSSSDYYPGKVKNVTLLGHGLVSFMESPAGLVIDLPETKVNELAAVFAIDFE